jgi:hypothetical protein
MQALAAEAGPASAAQALGVPPHAGQQMLSCGYDAIDAFLGGFERGRCTALDASTPLLWDVALGALVQATVEGEAVAVDGGNSLDPYLVAAHARRAGIAPRRVLERLRIARAFTAHQMSAILEETLLPEVLDHTPSVVLVSCLPELYLDEDVPWVEANALVGRAMDLLRDLARDHGCAVLATNIGLGKLAARPRLRTLFHGADRVVRMLPQGEGVVLEDLPAGRRAFLQAPQRGQRTLANFDAPAERAPPMASPMQLMAKGAA